MFARVANSQAQHAHTEFHGTHGTQAPTVLYIQPSVPLVLFENHKLVTCFHLFICRCATYDGIALRCRRSDKLPHCYFDPGFFTPLGSNSKGLEKVKMASLVCSVQTMRPSSQ